jgi:hypothetical protein
MRATWPQIMYGHDADSKAPAFKFSVNEATNSVVLDGPKAYLDTVADMIHFFDVKPQQVTLEIRCSSSEDGLKYSSQATIENQTTWDCKWDAMQESTSIKPRINNDGTITLLVDVEFRGTKTGTVLRLSSGKEGAIPSTLMRNLAGLDIVLKARISP